MAQIRVMRVYETPRKADGFRILVDRLWPRGVSKDKAPVDLWLKEIAPSTELRKWFGHGPERWPEFKQRYFRELDGKAEVVSRMYEKAAGRDIVLVYSAKDELRNQAVCLREYLQR